MANGFSGVSQAEAIHKILAAGYAPMTIPVQEMPDTWHCMAMKQARVYVVVVDRSGGVDGRMI
jgi:hypothetical protein